MITEDREWDTSVMARGRGGGGYIADIPAGSWRRMDGEKEFGETLNNKTAKGCRICVRSSETSVLKRGLRSGISRKRHSS
jgi:hypothetical protein